MKNERELDSKNNPILLIPSNPDLTIRAEIEKATSSNSPTCTCQVELHLRADSNSVIYSIDSDGRRKTRGGDEFYVVYEESTLASDDCDVDVSKQSASTSKAVAFVSDNDDGTYELDFCTTPMTTKTENADTNSTEKNEIIRTITVYFEYTNSIGFLSPPSKNDWLNGGYSHKKYKIELSVDACRPLIREFSPSNTNIDLSRFDQVFAFGDSTFCQFLRQRPNKKGKYYFRENLRIIGEKVRMPLNSSTVDDFLQLIREDELELELSNKNDLKKKALIVGSCLWDILSADDTLQGSEYEDHCDACRKYIYQLRQSYPGVSLLWKSPMAVHIHWVSLERVVEHDRATATLFGINRIKYMSSSRSFFLYKVQKQLMEELGVPMLDLYEATHLSADQLYPSDGRHYKPDLNRKMLSWFYPCSPLNPSERIYFQHVI